MSTPTATGPGPEFCANPECRKPRKFRKGSATCREGSNGLCSACTTREHKARGGEPADPYTGKPWWEQPATPERAPRVPLKSGDHGYRPSTGTARRDEAA